MGQANNSFFVVYHNGKIIHISRDFFVLFDCFSSLEDFFKTHNDITELFIFEYKNRKYYSQNDNQNQFWFQSLTTEHHKKSRVVFGYKGQEYHYEIFVSNSFANPNESIVYFNSLATQLQKEQRTVRFYHEKQSKMAQLEKLSKHKDKLSLMGEMMENITHQWKQPLTNILFTASTIQLQRSLEILSDKDLNISIENIIEAVNYMSQTVNDFKSFLNQEKQKRVFEIGEILHKIESIIKGNIKRHSIDLIINSDIKLYAFGFENELVQAIINIINNATDALKSKDPIDRRIELSLTQIDSKSILKIEDNGGGIPLEIMNKIFEHYFTTKGENGSGIGLHMTKDIIENHFRGELKVYNSEVGAVFEIMLPLYVFEEIEEIK